MSITQWPKAERPREKLLQAGPAALSDAELLAIFLRTGYSGHTAVDLSRQLLQHFGSLRQLLEAAHNDFCSVKGLGSAKYAQLQASLEMGRRHLQERLQQPQSFLDAASVEQFLVSKLRHRGREVFAVIYLNNQHQLLAYEELFQGTINAAEVHPREVVKRSLHHNAAAVIFAHNHPSGVSEPSQSDCNITHVLKDALQLVDIRVLDHFVIGEGRPSSLASLGML